MRFLLLAIFFCFNIFCSENIIKDHFTVGDFHSALKESQKAFLANPNSSELSKLLLKSLALNGYEKEMLSRWRDHLEKFPESINDRDLLETISWAIINKGGESTNIRIKMATMFGALGTQDTYAVNIFQKNMEGSNYYLRSLAARLSPAFRDKKLRHKLLYLIENDPVWNVRLEAIVAAGKIRMQEAKIALQNILKNDFAIYDEKMAAINALLEIYENIDDTEFEELINSKHAEFRLLACEMAIRFDLKRHQKKIASLLQDANDRVRIAAISLLGIWRAKEHANIIGKFVGDFNFTLSITASWFMLINGFEIAERQFEIHTSSLNEDERRLAAAALASSGSYGVKLAEKILRKSKDRYVSANLAFGLIGQREKVELASEAILKLLSSKSAFMWKNSYNPIFRTLAPSFLNHRPEIVNFPQLVSNYVRLELLNMLAILKHPKAKSSLKQFLREKRWNITGIASEIILKECDESATGLIYELLEEDSNIKIQAALVLANLNKDERALEVLESSYKSADRNLKIQILESFGHFSAKKAAAFLSEVLLTEQSSFLKVTAAASLAKSLNN